MDRSGPEFPTNADLAAGLFPLACEGRFEADIGPGGSPHRRSLAGTSGRRGGCRPSKSGTIIWKSPALPGRPIESRRRRHWCRSARQGSQRIAAASADRDGTARRTPRRRDRGWRDRNADAGADLSGDARPFDVFPGEEKRNKRRVFGYWEVGLLLEGLAHRPAPAVSGLDEGPFTIEMHDDGEPSRAMQTEQAFALGARRGCLRGPTISAGTIRSIAGGAAPN